MISMAYRKIQDGCDLNVTNMSPRGLNFAAGLAWFPVGPALHNFPQMTVLRAAHH